MEVDIQFSDSWNEAWKKDQRQQATWEQFQLAYEATNWTSIPTFDGLLCKQHLPQLDIYPHQERTAKRVIEEMDGKAILADEVGLGKTIEAGLILKEYMVRGLVNKALILVPATLVRQWVKELNEKFHIPAVEQKKSYVWKAHPIVVGSIDTAKRPPHRDIVLQQSYDMIIFDEAHRLKNAKTKNYQFARSLERKFCLMLTATPVQNHPGELYHLVHLLKPGLLGSYKEFRTLFEQGGEKAVKHMVEKVMVRHRREETGFQWTKRRVSSIYLDFTKEERELYNLLFSLKEDATLKGLTMTTLLKEACSSKEAVYLTLKNLYEENVITEDVFTRIISAVEKVKENTKAEKALEIIASTSEEEKVVLFTEYKATQLYLQWYFAQHGISSVPFRGGFKRSKKEWMQQLFQTKAKVLIATEAGGEGINLQFSNIIINYDLPWNPMRLEQRIGRLHRLGQKKDVQIYHFAVNETIEEHILSLLYEKIALFENVIGQLDTILSSTSVMSVEKYIHNVLETSHSKKEMALKMKQLTYALEQGGRE